MLRLLRAIRRDLASLRRYYQVSRNPVGYARSIGVRVGEGCFFPGLSVGTFGSEPYLITLGNRVAIAAGAKFLTHNPVAWLMRDKHPDIESVSPIVVGDNVVIGANAIIMQGVTIGSNCMIGAAAVVTHDVPPGSVVAGVPARVVGSLEDAFAKVLAHRLDFARLPHEEKVAALKKHFRIDE